ncbi:MAG: Vitamin epoxide reductase [Gemmatimonadetes bacterium]|nr:Vitamin epoxide reductase [Gemmatimonadota bacterium]
MLAALVALAGMFVALYLMLYKLGYIGTLACAVGSCETVQTSKWATFLGLPVAAWGVAYYVAILGVSLAGLMPAFAERRSVSQLLVVMTGVGLLFSLWLTYLELFVIDAICQWCVISAILATALFVICWLDLRDADRWVDDIAQELRRDDATRA